jgi:hypothetical protein
MNTAKAGARYGLGNQAIASRIAYEVIRYGQRSGVVLWHCD